jgi:hypothetical protein
LGTHSKIHPMPRTKTSRPVSKIQLKISSLPPQKILHVLSTKKVAKPLSLLGLSRVFNNSIHKNMVYLLDARIAGEKEVVYEVAKEFNLPLTNEINIENWLNYTHAPTSPIEIKDIQVLRQKIQIPDYQYKKKSEKVVSPKKIKLNPTKIKSCGTPISDLPKLLSDLSKVGKGLGIDEFEIQDHRLYQVKSYPVKKLTSKLENIPVPYLEGHLIVKSKDALAKFLMAIQVDPTPYLDTWEKALGEKGTKVLIQKVEPRTDSEEDEE